MTTPQTHTTRAATTYRTNSSDEDNGLTDSQRRWLIILAIVALVGVMALIAGAIWLVGNPVLAAAMRDVFIIFMALEFMLIGVALVILIVQLAVLTNMLQHEIKPIIESTNETVNTVRGTATFLSENLVEPVIKLNSYAAVLAQVAQSLGMLSRLRRKK